MIDLKVFAILIAVSTAFFACESFIDYEDITKLLSHDPMNDKCAACVHDVADTIKQYFEDNEVKFKTKKINELISDVATTEFKQEADEPEFNLKEKNTNLLVCQNDLTSNDLTKLCHDLNVVKVNEIEVLKKNHKAYVDENEQKVKKLGKKSETCEENTLKLISQNGKLLDVIELYQKNSEISKDCLELQKSQTMQVNSTLDQLDNVFDLFEKSIHNEISKDNTEASGTYSEESEQEQSLIEFDDKKKNKDKTEESGTSSEESQREQSLIEPDDKKKRIYSYLLKKIHRLELSEEQ